MKRINNWLIYIDKIYSFLYFTLYLFMLLQHNNKYFFFIFFLFISFIRIVFNMLIYQTAYIQLGENDILGNVTFSNTDNEIYVLMLTVHLIIF